MKYLLDTDHLSVLQKSTGRDYECLSARMAKIPSSRGLILLTRNHRDFIKVPGLSIEDWTQES